MGCAAIIGASSGCRVSYNVSQKFDLGTADRESETLQPALGPLAFHGASTLLRKAVEDGAFPGAITVAGWGGRIVYTDAVGTLGVTDPALGVTDPAPVDTSTLYDLASLTKVVAMTTSVMMLVAEGKIDLDTPASEYLPEFRAGAAAGVTIRHLLTHSSGLQAYRRLHLETDSREAALDSIFATPLAAPPGSSYVYSDLGAIILGFIVERVSQEPLDLFTQRRIFEPLDMTSTGYRPPAEWYDRVALTEFDPRRGGVLRGVVHDENAYHLGQVAGHAGLFSTAPDLSRFAIWMLDAYHGRIDASDAMYVPQHIVREFVRRQPGPNCSTRALGWDTPSLEGSTAGDLMSRESFGHTGFTGTSIWIDPHEEFFIILLTNRVNPTRDNQLIRKVRGPLADSVYASIMSAPAR